MGKSAVGQAAHKIFDGSPDAPMRRITKERLSGNEPEKKSGNA